MRDVLSDLIVVKRSGQRVSFNGPKIALAIKGAFDNVYETYEERKVNAVYNLVIDYIIKEYAQRKTIQVEDIQDIIETQLKKVGLDEVHDAFKQYRNRRRLSRETFPFRKEHKFVKAIEEVVNYMGETKDQKPFEILLKHGNVINKEFAKSHLIDNKYLRKHEDGSIYIHNLDVYALGLIDSYHVNLAGVSGKNLQDFTRNVTKVLITLKKDIAGVVSVTNLDDVFFPFVVEEYKSILKKNIYDYLLFEGFEEYINLKKLEEHISKIETPYVDESFFDDFIPNEKLKYIFNFALSKSLKSLNSTLKENLKFLINDLENIDTFLKNDEFSFSISLGNIVSNIIIEILLEKDYLDKVGIIFKIKDGSNFDLLAPLIFKNVSFINGDSNLDYFPNGQKVYDNYWGENDSNGKMVISKVAVNLARIGIESQSEEEYFAALEKTMELSKNYLVQNFEYTAGKYKDNYEILFNNEIFTSIDIEASQKIRKIIKNGTLFISFVGLYESVVAFKKVFDEKFASHIINFMNELCKKYTEEEKLNIKLHADMCPKVQSDLLKIDKTIFGNILNVTDKEKYSFAFDKCKFSESELINSQKNLSGGFVKVIKVPKNISNKRIVEEFNLAINKDCEYFKFNTATRGDT